MHVTLSLVVLALWAPPVAATPASPQECREMPALRRIVGPSREVRRQARKELIEAGAAAVPCLLPMILDEDRLPDAPTELRCGEVAEALFRIGAPAVPGVLDAVPHRCAYWAVQGWARWRPDLVVPALRAALSDPVRAPTAATLLVTYVGARDGSLVRPLLAALEDSVLASDAVNALAWIGEPAWRPLAREVEAGNVVAASALGEAATRCLPHDRAGSDRLSTIAVPVLERALAVPALRQVATEALFHYPSGQPLIEAASQSPDVTLRLAVVRAIRQPGHTALLARATADPSPEVRREAVRAFVLWRDEVPDADEVMRRALRDADPEVRRRALAGLTCSERWCTGGNSRALIEEALLDPDADVRHLVEPHAHLLGDAGPGALARALELRPENCTVLLPQATMLLQESPGRTSAALPLLRRGLTVAGCETMVAAALAVAQPQAQAILVDALRSSEEPARWTAVSILRRLGDRATGVSTAVIPMLDDPERREPAAEALAAIVATGDETAVPGLVRALGDVGTRWAAAVALARIGPRALPALRRALSHPLRLEPALVAIARMGPDAGALVKPVARLRRHREPRVRAAAEFAWKCLQVHGPPRPG